jgi:hypothetical protein
MPLHVDRPAMLRDHPRRLCSIGRTPAAWSRPRADVDAQRASPAANLATWLRQLVTWLTRGTRLQRLHGAARTLPVEPAARTNAALAIELKCSLKESKEQSSATGIGAASILAGTASAS